MLNCIYQSMQYLVKALQSLYGRLSLPITNDAMQKGMVYRTGDKQQVFRTVVKTISIDVMHMLGLKKRPFDNPFHYQSVLKLSPDFPPVSNDSSRPSWGKHRRTIHWYSGSRSLVVHIAKTNCLSLPFTSLHRAIRRVQRLLSVLLSKGRVTKVGSANNRPSSFPSVNSNVGTTWYWAQVFGSFLVIVHITIIAYT